MFRLPRPLGASTVGIRQAGSGSSPGRQLPLGLEDADARLGEGMVGDDTESQGGVHVPSRRCASSRPAASEENMDGVVRRPAASDEKKEIRGFRRSPATNDFTTLRGSQDLQQSMKVNDALPTLKMLIGDATEHKCNTAKGIEEGAGYQMNPPALGALQTRS